LLLPPTPTVDHQRLHRTQTQRQRQLQPLQPPPLPLKRQPLRRVWEWFIPSKERQRPLQIRTLCTFRLFSQSHLLPRGQRL
jgi:hypothetical protein